MQVASIDLYAAFSLPRPTGAAGELRMWVQHTAASISPARRRPAVLILPGGAYERCSARESEPVALRFAARGYAAFSLNYSCTPLPFPTALREAAMAMCYIRRHADELEVAPDRIAAIGFSAGGHLCGLLGTLFDDEALRDLGSPRDIAPNALGLCYPVAVSSGRTHEGTWRNLTLGDDRLRKRLSLETLVRSDMPPTFLWHTREDASVPCRNSLLLATAMEEAGVSFVLHIYNRGKHGLSVADATAHLTYDTPPVSADVPAWPERMMDFFAEQGFCITDREE